MKKHRTTHLTDEEQSRRMALYNKGLSDRAIAEAEGIASSTVAGWRYNHNLPANIPRPATHPIDEEKRYKLYNAGCTDKEIANALNLPIYVINGWRKVRGLPRNPHMCDECGKRPAIVKTTKKSRKKLCSFCRGRAGRPGAISQKKKRRQQARKQKRLSLL